MKERGILFSAPMVLAILDGRKTQTRRLVRDGLAVTDVCGGGVEPAVWWPRDATGRDARCPYGDPGDRLWVRETWRRVGDEIRFRASCAELPGETWKPGIHLRRIDARIVLEVTEVRVQRLKDISEDDARSEGARCMDLATGREAILGQGSYRDHFRYIWENINWTRAPWSSNPWVWAISFRRVLP